MMSMRIAIIGFSAKSYSYLTIIMGKKDKIGLFLLRILETEHSIRVFRSYLRKYCINLRGAPQWTERGLCPPPLPFRAAPVGWYKVSLVL